MSDGDEPRKTQVPVDGFFLTLRCTSDGKPYMQVCSVRFDTIYQVNAQSEGDTLVLTSVGAVVNTIHTREEVMDGIAAAQANQTAHLKMLGGLVKLL